MYETYYDRTGDGLCSTCRKTSTAATGDVCPRTYAGARTR